jgi:Flp pilus assembly protein TadD
MHRIANRFGRVLVGLAITGAVACAPTGPSLRKAEQAAQRGAVEDAIPELESLRKQYPRDFDVRLALGQLYYRVGRKALDEDRQKDYLRFLGKALDEVVEAARIDPASPSPHTWMGIIAAYQDDLDGSVTSFKNALRLDRRIPVTYTNLAQVYLYQGKIAVSRNWLTKGKKLGARGAYVDLLESLMAWRQGDLVEARDLFDMAYASDPEEVNTWDEAPVDKPIESFEDFTAYCCGNHTCGPHMGNACQKMKLAVKERELLDETFREELRLEMERRRKLQEIYKGRRDLQIEVEAPEPVPETTGTR